MEFLGFVPLPLIPPIAAQIASFVGLAATTVAATLGIKKAVDAATLKSPQSSVGGDVSFQPWGDDPYEPEPLPDPEPSMAPLAESTLAPVPAPAPAPAPVPQPPEQVNKTTDPQSPLDSKHTVVPAPLTPGTAGRLGGWTFRVSWEPSTKPVTLVLRVGDEISPSITPSWNAVSYEVEELLVKGQYAYKARVRVLLGAQTTYLWILPEVLQRPPDLSAYVATTYLTLDNGDEEVRPIQELAALGTGFAGALGKPLVKTFQPKQMPPAPTPEVEPETETETESDSTNNQNLLLAPPWFPYPLLPPDSTPLPLKPEDLPYLDNEGRPILPLPPTVIQKETHIIYTDNGPKPIPGGTANPSLNSIASEVQRIEAKAAQLIQGQNNGIWDRLPELILLLQGLADLFEQSLPAKEYRLESVCDGVDEEGNRPATTVILPPEMWADRLISQADVVPDLLQAHLGYKTPTCSDDRPKLEGDWRTISFRSDETSPYGKSRLRKRFRYRSTSGFGLSEIVTHWAGFTFEAGPVCVIHSGSAWGTPQVWAATADEGKRVIRHAGGEAGINPDQVGRWTVSGSDSARVGVSGTMRVDTTGGFYWITARDGSDSRALVAKT